MDALKTYPGVEIISRDRGNTSMELLMARLMQSKLPTDGICSATSVTP